MRSAKGKLICIWPPVGHGEGCTTLACGIGFSVHHHTDKRVLIVDRSNSASPMEKFVEKDIEIKYSMDNLNIFNNELKTEHILTFATQINKELYMIAGSKLKRNITGGNNEFDKIFIDKCLNWFDLVIADLDAGVRDENKLYLDMADIILTVFTPNEIVIDELHDNPGILDALDYFTNAKSVSIINKLYDGWDTGRVMGRYKSRYSLSDIFGLNYDGDVLNACCTDRNFYSFLMKELKRDKNILSGSWMKFAVFLSEGCVWGILLQE